MQMRFKFTLATERAGARSTVARDFLMETVNREKQKLARDTDINNCRASRRECLFMKRKLLFLEGGQPIFRPVREYSHTFQFILHFNANSNIVQLLRILRRMKIHNARAYALIASLFQEN
jgi:hypothetical protein